MKNLIKDTLSFISKTHSPFHAINNIENLLIDNGFEKISESRQFNIQRGGKYFYISLSATQSNHPDGRSTLYFSSSPPPRC